ncbi:uncharacterized protein LOC118431567 [Branchiostoma floridae]|uniref:Uncharacterized protein LOC118431567 n=1 Tax=Branchiostoma floridae TaxID=7739 RepID=A0A9J7NA68_BRAFL|nr:uncharacterized protein LOC118431567 [Branchiostoma floridae]
MKTAVVANQKIPLPLQQLMLQAAVTVAVPARQVNRKLRLKNRRARLSPHQGGPSRRMVRKEKPPRRNPTQTVFPTLPVDYRFIRELPTAPATLGCGADLTTGQKQNREKLWSWTSTRQLPGTSTPYSSWRRGFLQPRWTDPCDCTSTAS